MKIRQYFEKLMAFADRGANPLEDNTQQLMHSTVYIDQNFQMYFWN